MQQNSTTNIKQYNRKYNKTIQTMQKLLYPLGNKTPQDSQPKYIVVIYYYTHPDPTTHLAQCYV